MYVARIKIVWEEQLVDPLAEYLTSVIAVLNKPVNPEALY